MNEQERNEEYFHVHSKDGGFFAEIFDCKGQSLSVTEVYPARRQARLAGFIILLDRRVKRLENKLDEILPVVENLYFRQSEVVQEDSSETCHSQMD